MNEPITSEQPGNDDNQNSYTNIIEHHSTAIDITNPALSRALRDINAPVEWASFPVDNTGIEMKLASMRCYIGNDIRRLKHEAGVLVSNLYLTSQSYIAKDGSLIEGPVLHLIGPDGKSCRIVAKYTILQILTFAKSWKPFPWVPPVRMVAHDEITDNDQRIYVVDFKEP